MVTLTFYGGVNEIGGNKFLLEGKKTRIFLDFGKNFSREKRFFEEPFIKAREEKHLLALKILPNIDGLYEKDEKKYHLDGVIITHPHTDHYDCIRFLKDDYPVYCGEATKNIIVAREFSSQSIGEGYNICKLTSREEIVCKDFRTFRTGDTVEISNFKVTPVHVDHSVPASYGFILETNEGNIVYSGDLRMHGPMMNMTLDFLEKAKSFEPEVLLIEGTHIGACKIESEEEVFNKVERIISLTEKLVLAGFSQTDFDRLRTFYEAAKNNDRKLGVSMKQAYMLHMLRKDPKLELPKLNDPNILIFAREKKSLREYEKRIRETYPENIIDSKEINKIQEELVLVCTLYDMNEMIDIRPEAGSNYILSSSEPFDEEMEISYEKLLNWLEFLGIPLYQTHASGHASPHEIKYMIREISPRKVFPIHTERPELFKKFISDLDVEVILPEEGKKYDF
ncbi:MAG: MBL fold metallo-hydrolase [Candidatus Hydrothermarchaeota archaeon]